MADQTEREADITYALKLHKQKDVHFIKLSRMFCAVAVS